MRAVAGVVRKARVREQRNQERGQALVRPPSPSDCCRSRALAIACGVLHIATDHFGSYSRLSPYCKHGFRDAALVGEGLFLWGCFFLRQSEEQTSRRSVKALLERQRDAVLQTSALGDRFGGARRAGLHSAIVSRVCRCLAVPARTHAAAHWLNVVPIHASPRRASFPERGMARASGQASAQLITTHTHTQNAGPRRCSGAPAHARCPSGERISLVCVCVGGQFVFSPGSGGGGGGDGGALCRRRRKKNIVFLSDAKHTHTHHTHP